MMIATVSAAGVPSPSSAAAPLIFLGIPAVLAVMLVVLLLSRRKLAESERVAQWREMARGWVFKVVVSVLGLAAVSAVFVPILQANRSLLAQANRLAQEVQQIEIASDQSAAKELLLEGTVTVDGKVYGGKHVSRQIPRFYDTSGRLLDLYGLLGELIRDERPTWIPSFLLEQPETTWLLYGIAAVWILLVIWMDLLGAFVLTAAATATLAMPLYWRGNEGLMLAVLGMGMLTFTFALLMQTVLLVLNRPWQPLAVAHTVVKESMRLRISVAFIGILLVVLPLIPLLIDDKQPLRYQIQTFLSRSMNFTYVIAACMTLLLSCATVAFEIRDRQIWQLMTKPMSRFGYLLGKWLGVAAVNLVLFLICGVSIFTFVQYLSGRAAADEEDLLAVREQVMTARMGSYPIVPRLNRDQLEAMANERIESDLVLKNAIDSGERNQLDVQKEIALQLQKEYMLGQRTVMPSENVRPPALPTNGRTYEFPNLGRAKEINAPLTMRYLFHIGDEDQHEQHPVAFYFPKSGRMEIKQFVPVVRHVLYLSPDEIDEKGTLTMTIFNIGSMPLNFDDRDIQVMFRVSSFEANFVRAVFVQWIKLSFLAMVGVCGATFLSFPVAALFAFTVLMLSSMVMFLSESLELYELAKMSRPDQIFIREFGRMIEFFFAPIGRLSPTESLVEGRYIDKNDIATAVLLLGAVWCGVSLAIGYLVFRRRELAIYSGHG